MTKQDLYEIITNNGYTSDGVKFEIADALASPDSGQLLGQIYTEVVQELIELQAIGQRLVQTIRHDDIIGESTTFKWFGAGNVPNVERGESGEYPEFTLAAGKSSTIRAQFMQRGLTVKITAENIKYSRWDLIRAHITQAGLALQRAKEALIFSTFEQAGVVVFDNNDPMNGGAGTDPAVSVKGRGTGRDRYGNKNGSLTYEDYVDMVSIMISNGYNPNVLLVHPLCLPIFQKDPILRHIGLVNGNPEAFLNSSRTSPNAYKNGTVDTWRKQQRAANGNSQTLSDRDVNLLSTASPELPSFHPLSGMTVIVSPMVPYDPTTKTTSLILIDTSASAILNEQVPLTVNAWEEMSREIQVVRIKEAYSVDVIDEGRGIAVAKNIPLVPNEIYNDPQVVINDLTP
jgi:hypothetical protein